MIYDTLKSHQSQIEADYGRPLKWYNQEGTRSCKVFDELLDVSVTNHDDWPAMIKSTLRKGPSFSRSLRHICHDARKPTRAAVCERQSIAGNIGGSNMSSSYRVVRL